MLIVALNRCRGGDDLPGLVTVGCDHCRDGRLIMSGEGAQVLREKVELVLHEERRRRVAERPVLHRVVAAVPRPVGVVLRGGAEFSIAVPETCSVLWAVHVEAPEQVGEPLIHAQHGHLVNGRDDDGGKETVYILVRNENRESAAAPGACAGAATPVFDDPALRLVPEVHRFAAEGTIKEALVLLRWSGLHVSPMHIIVNGIGRGVAPHVVAKRESGTTQSLRDAYQVGHCQGTRETLQLLEGEESEWEADHGRHAARFATQSME